MIAMASYNNFKNNIYRDAIMIPIINCATSIYAGFAVFAVLGYLAHVKNVNVADVADSGPGLVFIVYPEALENMPVPTLWSILFFFMMILLGFSSLFSIVETIFTSIMDIIPELRATVWRPILLRGISIAIFFAVIVPDTCPGGFYLFTLVDSATGGYPLLFMGLLELLAVNLIYGTTNFSDDIELMLGRRPNIYYRLCWMFITTVLLLFIIIYSIIEHSPLSVDQYVYPDWCNILYWMIVAFTLVWIPIMAVVYIYKRGGVRAAAEPSRGWGPALSENRTGKYRSNSIEMLEEDNAKASKGMVYDNQGMYIRDEGYGSKDDLSKDASSLDSVEVDSVKDDKDSYTIKKMDREPPSYRDLHTQQASTRF